MPEPARSFQHYEVLRQSDGTPWELGRGAMGVTYKAFDVNLCCEVALKVVTSALVENAEARERFVREARAAAALRHRNVASVYHLGNDGEHFFYAMEFIRGETLDALVRREGPLSVENTLRVVLQVARALAAAERQGLVHRDIKPANLMVTHEDADEETVVKVIDFGLARPASNADNAPPLTIGGFVGTPQYASPEQLEERPLDARSDLYSLGITAWFLLTGRVPFTGSLATICQLQLTQPPPWEQLAPDVPTCVRGLLGHLLAKDPARRPQNAAGLRAEIETCLDKVQGTDRKRDLHLPALSPTTASRRDSPLNKAPRLLQTGTLLLARYRLLREIGGRNGVRVYHARDESDFEKPVAVRILAETPMAGSAGRDQSLEEIKLVRAATHPNLIQVHSLERSASPAVTFLVEEWLTGFTLRDLLAGRSGALPVAEVLQVLGQAASAADHAAKCRLENLDLTLPDLLVHFPTLTSANDDGTRVRGLCSERMANWPDWTLKIPAFRPGHDTLTSDTWAGGVTLVPLADMGARPLDAAATHVQALARMVYELLGGTPGSPAKYVALSVLNEEANTVLRQALTGESESAQGWQLHAALATAIGGEPARGNAHVRTPDPMALPMLGSPAATLTREDSPFEGRDSTVSASASSAATLFEDSSLPGADDLENEVAGSAWDRLSLVTRKRAHPARWLVGIAGLVIVFMLVFTGVLVWLLQQQPPRMPVADTPGKQRLASPVAPPADHSSSRRATPAPLPPRPVDPAPTLAVTEHQINVPSPAERMHAASSPAVARAENVPPSPAPTDPPR